MKIKESTMLKKEQIEINIVEMIKFIWSKSIWVIVCAIIIAILIPSLKYIVEKNNVEDTENIVEDVMTDSDILQSYTSSLEIYEKAYATEKDYRENSILMNLDYKNINTATIQFYVKAEEQMLLDALTAYTNYSNDGGLVSDVYKIDDTISERYLKEIIKVTCSNYGSYDVSSVIGIKVYGRDKDECSYYVGLVINALEAYSKLLNETGINHSIEKFYENYYMGQDSTVWTVQKNLTSTMTELENNITNIQTQIDTLRENGVKLPEEIENINSGEAKATFSIKYAIVGFVIGLILAIIFLIIKYMVNDKVKYATELSEITEISFIGEVLNKKEKCKDKYALVKSERLIYKIQSICKYYKTNEITLIGNVESCSEELATISDRLNKEEIKVKVTGDVVGSIDAMKAFGSDESVILVALANETSYTYVEEIIKLCAVKESNVLGYIYIK